MEDFQLQIQQLTQALEKTQAQLKEFEQFKTKIERGQLSKEQVFNNPVRSSLSNPIRAGGGVGLYMGPGDMGIFYGSGAPTIAADKGSFYMRSDGSSSSTRLYVNSDGGTTWVAVTTAS